MSARKRKRPRLLFLGAGELAVPALEALVDDDLVPEVVVGRRLVSSAGRRRKSPLLAWAKESGLEIAEVKSGELEEWFESRSKAAPELIVAVDYRRPLAAPVVAAAKKGCVGLHFSALPKLRGPDPIRRALAEGESETGVTTYLVETEGDEQSGPILLQETVAVAQGENYGELSSRLAEIGAGLLVETVRRLTGSGKSIKPKEQREDSATRAPRMTRRHRKAPWWHPAPVVFNRLRAQAPEHGLSAILRRQPVEILRGRPMDWVEAPYGSVGTVLGMRLGRIAVLCGEGTVFGIDRLRREGGKAMGAGEFAVVERVDVGDRFS